MDIWKWYDQYEDAMYEAGQSYIIDQLNKFMGSIVDVKPEISESLLPEARSFKKTAENPWLEVLIGHWEMRHRLGNMWEGETALADAVKFFERAHLPDAYECPQSVCATHDLSTCYGNIDGPSWADERIAVCQETMVRITPLWNCFQCLSDEQFFAMTDKGEGLKALNYIREQIQKMRDAGAPDVSGLQETEAIGLINIGRYDEALLVLAPLCEQDELQSCSVQTQNARLMIRAEAYASMGNTDDAYNSLINWQKLQIGGVERWVRIIEKLSKFDPSFNSWKTGAALQEILERLIQAQAWRAAVNTALTHAHLALARNATWVARKAIKQANECLPHLRKLMGVDSMLAQLEHEIVKVEQGGVLPVPANELYNWLEERAAENNSRNPEEEAEWLKLATAQLPEDESLIILASSAFEACHAIDEAVMMLQNWQLHHPNIESPPLFELINILARAGRFDELSGLAPKYQNGIPHVAHWCEMQVALGREDWVALEKLSQLMLETPEGKSKVSPLIMGSRAAMKLGASGRAIPRLQQALDLLESQGQNTNHVSWDLITAASINEEWDIVREVGTKLGMQFDSSEGVVDEDWGVIRIRFNEEHDFVYYLAQRTGPATARIIQPSSGKRKQHLNDVVVFDVELLNTPPENDEERKYFIGIYECMEIVAEGDYAASWFVDGVYPGEQIFEKFKAKIQESGGRVWVTSEDDYQVYDNQRSGSSLPGIYFNLATPLSMMLPEVDRMLYELTCDWEHPVHWLSVAVKGQMDESRHRQIIERYGL